MIDDGQQQAGDIWCWRSTRAGCASRSARQAARDAGRLGRARRSAPRSRRCSPTASAALGANADPLPLPDVNQALQSGAIDGVEANLPLIYTQQWYEQAKNVTGNVNLWPFPTVLVINKAKSGTR